MSGSIFGIINALEQPIGGQHRAFAIIEVSPRKHKQCNKVLDLSAVPLTLIQSESIRVEVPEEVYTK